jgi:5-(carboxyamino)imidazole ribonucleotide synthase
MTHYKTILPAPVDAGAQATTLGVMGGGQLGRMFVHAAQRLGYFTAVLDPDVASPAGLVSHVHVQTDYLDEQGLAQMLRRCAAITVEFENVPAGALYTLGAHLPAAPDFEAVSTCQDRAREKQHFVACGVPCAPHALIETTEQLAAVPDALLPGILKTARLGYDGKGQVRVATREALAAAWQTLGQAPCVLEQLLPLAFEISVVLARSAHGDIVTLPVQRNLHRDGILAVTTVPAPGVSEALAGQALDAARRIAEGLRYVGVLCVEFFVLDDGLGGQQLVANEMAPRPHNSGHHSIDACDVSQFELQVRCMTGLPLPAPRQHSAAVMLNLLGDLWFDPQGRERTPDWVGVLALPGAHLHLYGKAGARPGRKMGHLTLTAATPEAAQDAALQAAALLGIAPF